MDDAAGFEEDGGVVSHEELASDVFGLRAKVPHGGVVAVRAERAAVVAAVFAALEGWAAEVVVGPTDVQVPPGAHVVDDALERADDVCAARGELPSVRTRWVLSTSGTTGEAKPMVHTHASLARTVQPRPGGPGRRWGLLYVPTRMAGVQVVLQVLGAREHLLDPRHLPRLSERLGWLGDRRVDAISATPTLWRQVLQTPAASALPLRQVTLGGEIADQRLLDGLRLAFPDARVTHVFASTETGAAFAVHDGKAGFPRSWLDEPPHGIRLVVRDGLLLIHAPQVSVADEEGFVSTGDAVEVRGDRVHFLGRATGVVNVGGVMVWPERVEAVLRSHPEVADALVTARRNAFSGAVLTGEAVPTRDADTETLPSRLRALCAQQMEPAAVPATVKVVPALGLTVTGKVVRR